MDCIKMTEEYIADTYARFPVTIVSGSAAKCRDENGKEYIDMGSGIGVNIFGYCDGEWVSAVTRQLSTLSHTSNLYYTQPGALLARELCRRTGLKKCFFANSGAEANECAIKTARKYSLDKYSRADRNEIITLNRSFHGRTLATLTATGQQSFHTTFGPFPEGFLYADTSSPESVFELAGENTCAIMIEMVQGEGGVLPLDKNFVKKVYQFCREHDIIIIIDEVQTGNGRTGTLYAYEQYDIEPDIVTTAKGIGGGLPLGVCILGEKLKNTLDHGSHGSTFGMNPVVAAGALNIIKRIDAELLESVTAKGEYIRERLSHCKKVKSVSGLGLMLGIEVEGDAKQMVLSCIEKGVLPLTAKNKIRLLPPLNISYEDLTRAMDIITEVIEN